MLFNLEWQIWNSCNSFQIFRLYFWKVRSLEMQIFMCLTNLFTKGTVPQVIRQTALFHMIKNVCMDTCTSIHSRGVSILIKFMHVRLDSVAQPLHMLFSSSCYVFKKIFGLYIQNLLNCGLSNWGSTVMFLYILNKHWNVHDR